MVDIIIPTLKRAPQTQHFSMSDWDWSYSAWSIANDQIVSAPTSLRIVGTTPSARCIFLCKNAATLILPFGRISSWYRSNHAYNEVGFHFRNTAAPGLANRTNCYQAFWVLSNTFWTLNEWSAGVNTRNWTASKAIQSANTWYHSRLTWYLTIAVFQVIMETWDGSNWIQQGLPITVQNPLFEAATYTRTGHVSSTSSSSFPVWWDDTRIYEA